MSADSLAVQSAGPLNPAALTPSDKAAILIEALPYIQSLSGKTVVIKYGGNAMIDDQLKQQVMEDITLLRFVGIKPVVVHGGGPDISRMLKKLEIQSEFVNGLRKTDRQTLEVAQMVLIGKTNKEIVAGLSRQGAQAIGISGIDAGLLRCRPLQADEEGRTGPLGFVGDITAVDTGLIERLTADYIPVIAPIGSDYNGQSYNINADTVASQLAIALKAEKLILLTDVEGVKRPAPDGSLEIAHVLVASEVRQMIRDGVISGGMIPKVQACIDTISQGVNRAHIIDGRIPHCLLLEIFTHKGIGTMFTQQKRPYYPGEMI